MESGELTRLSKIDVRTIYAVGGWYIHPFRSVLFTSNGVVYSEARPVDVLNVFCVLHGSSYKGREEATRRLSHDQYKKKVPVMILSPVVAAFPTSSPHQLDCVWIFNHHLTFKELKQNLTEVIFPNGESIQVPVSKGLLEKQRSRMFSVLGYPSLHK